MFRVYSPFFLIIKNCPFHPAWHNSGPWEATLNEILFLLPYSPSLSYSYFLHLKFYIGGTLYTYWKFAKSASVMSKL